MRVVLSRAGRLVAIMVIALVAGFAALHAAPAAAQTVHHAQVAAKSVTPGWNNPCRRHCGCYSQCRCTYGYGGCGNGFGICGYGYADYGPAGGIGYGYGCCFPDCCYGSYSIYGNPGSGCCNSYEGGGYGYGDAGYTHKKAGGLHR